MKVNIHRDVADLIQRVLATIHFTIFCIPISYPKTWDWKIQNYVLPVFFVCLL